MMESFIPWPGSPVRAIRSQGVIYVHDAEDARGQRDLLPLQSTWVPCAIPFFVMAVGDIQCMTKIGDGLEHLKCIGGMQAHADPFFFG